MNMLARHAVVSLQWYRVREQAANFEDRGILATGITGTNAIVLVGSWAALASVGAYAEEARLGLTLALAPYSEIVHPG